MRSWKERWHTFTSCLICGAVVLFGTILYPLILLFFGVVALVYPLYRRVISRNLSILLLTFFLAASTFGCGQSGRTPSPGPPPSNGADGSPQPILLPPEASRWVNDGIAEYRQGRYLEAAAAFQRATNLVPADGRVSNFLGTALLQAKRYTPARAEYRRILALQPEALEPRLGLARIAIRLGEYEEATRDFREVLARDPANPLALYNLGLLRYREGDYAEARDLLHRLLQIKEDHPEAHYTLGLTYARLGREGEAEKEFRRVVALAPENTRAHFNLASLYARAGRTKEAAEEQEIFRRLSDRMASDRAAEGKARELFLSGDYAGALKEYDRLLELNPQSGRFQLGRGQCFLKMGEPDEAVAALEKARSLDPKLPDVHYHLAVLYQRRGEAENSERERRAFEALEAIVEGKTGF